MSADVEAVLRLHLAGMHANHPARTQSLEKLQAWHATEHRRLRRKLNHIHLGPDHERNTPPGWDTGADVIASVP